MFTLMFNINRCRPYQKSHKKPLQPVQAPPHCTKCNSPPINGQCTNIVIFDVAL